MSESKKIRVFLGGTCAKTTWRESLIPMLSDNVDYFNPQKAPGTWTLSDNVEEVRQRQICDILLYTIAKATSVLTIAEVIDDSHNRPERTICCILIDNMHEDVKKHFYAIAEILEKNGVQVFFNIHNAIREINGIAEELIEARSRKL